MRRRLLVVFSAALGGCWTSPLAPQGPVQNTAPIAPRAPALRSPLAAEFGTVDHMGEFHPGSEIPLDMGTTFGWRLELGCEHTVEVDERLELPAQGDWGTDPDLTISKDGRVARLQFEAVCRDGWIEKTWIVSADDPPGQWKLTVTASGFRPHVFYATFVEASPKSP